MSLRPPPGAPVVFELYDADTPNRVRVIEHDGRVYIEALGRHHGAEVYTLVRVDRGKWLRLVAGMR